MNHKLIILYEPVSSSLTRRSSSSLIQISKPWPFLRDDSLLCLSNLKIEGAEMGSYLFLSFSQGLATLPSGIAPFDNLKRKMP
jgi:hypothetical protein